MLLENLIRVESLSVSQCAELHGLCRNGHARVQLTFGVFQEVGDAVEQQRYVIEQVVGWENVVAIDGHSRADPIQPAPHDSLTFRTKSRGNDAP